ncbi:MAG: tRNA uracil 4-sulfurtransferase ThiI [Lachnospiraceae bacterium]|jgi:thiamine biosynthesis protein ThiI
MKAKAFLLKYAEIGIKGKNRNTFEQALVDRLQDACSRVEGNFAVERESGRIYVVAQSDFDEDEIVGALRKVFGVVWICPVVQVADNGFDDLKEQVVRYMKEEYPEGKFTFKVASRRARKNYPVHSQQMNADLGEAILKAFPEARVDVHEPQILVSVEVRDHEINIYSKRIPGAGGMPVGTGGKAMLLLSGGIDSPVAGYMISRRGVVLEAVYFNAPPYTSDRALQKVEDLAKIISAWTGPIRLHIINFTEIQLAIYQKCPHEELTIIMRRYMMRIAERIAEKTGCMGLVTGESIGQVASQTMQSLICTNAVCTLPVYRPVIAFDKQDIVDVAQKIGTFDTSTLPYEDCCTIFVAKHPVTHPILHIIENSEQKLADVSDEMIEKALAGDQVVVCRQ